MPRAELKGDKQMFSSYQKECQEEIKVICIHTCARISLKRHDKDSKGSYGITLIGLSNLDGKVLRFFFFNRRSHHQREFLQENVQRSTTFLIPKKAAILLKFSVLADSQITPHRHKTTGTWVVNEVKHASHNKFVSFLQFILSF